MLNKVKDSVEKVGVWDGDSPLYAPHIDRYVTMDYFVRALESDPDYLYYLLEKDYYLSEECTDNTLKNLWEDWSKDKLLESDKDLFGLVKEFSSLIKCKNIIPYCKPTDIRVEKESLKDVVFEELRNATIDWMHLWHSWEGV